ncbi:hypothetical protein KY284_003770 [Solanum tuberosum]|nr:hypothetical protein KY284_003770 [Solanum tuberosum]
MTSRDVVFYEENTWKWDEELSSQVLCDDESKDVAPRSEIPAIVTPNVEDLPFTEEPIKIEKVVTCVRRRPAWMQDYQIVTQ